MVNGVNNAVVMQTDKPMDRIFDAIMEHSSCQEKVEGSIAEV
jgi:hypothetical protein